MEFIRSGTNHSVGWHRGQNIFRSPRAGRELQPDSRHVPAAIQRFVWTRDQGRCTFVGPHGRCTETSLLQFHHKDPFAMGGAATADNIYLRCSAHNRYEAELFFAVTYPGIVRETRPDWPASEFVPERNEYVAPAVARSAKPDYSRPAGTPSEGRTRDERLGGLPRRSATSVVAWRSDVSISVLSRLCGHTPLCGDLSAVRTTSTFIASHGCSRWRHDEGLDRWNRAAAVRATRRHPGIGCG